MAASEHQEMNGLAEVTWCTIHILAHSMMVFARVDESFTHHASVYAAHHIVPILPLKDLTNKQGKSVTPHELMTGEKTKITYL